VARTGRRPGPNTTRSTILDAARHRFAAAGYNATSLRAIAADAGVDTGVVLHFFGSKDGLFRAAVRWPFDPARAEEALLLSTGEPLGTRLAATFFAYWEDPTTGPALAALLRSAMTNDEAAALLREFVAHELFSRVAARFGADKPELRIELAAAQLIGIALLRNILRVEPISSASVNDLVAWVGPALERYRETGWRA
jgi:AcrR family transcriptional regulator